MLREFLKNAKIESQANYVELGYGQVEPNHLSAQRTAQIYAQLPADASIEKLEQGQFVKYDYAALDANGNPTGGLVNFTGDGEWMLVYNEIKLYRENQLDCEFAMIKGNYQARVYSPLDGTKAAEELYGPTRFLQGRRERWNDVTGEFEALGEIGFDAEGKPTATNAVNAADYSVATQVHDYYEMNDINNPDIADTDPRSRLFMKLRAVKHPEKMMPAGTTMVPRVFKTNVGDHYTTNTINYITSADELKVGALLYVGKKGILTTAPVEAIKGEFAGSGDMVWQVVKVYTMPDHQRGVKIMRIK